MIIGKVIKEIGLKLQSGILVKRTKACYFLETLYAKLQFYGLNLYTSRVLGHPKIAH